MGSIDSLLGIVVRQEASELRLASNRPPRLFRGSDERPLTMPATSGAALLALVGDLVEPHEAALRERGSAMFAYHGGDAGEFEVSVSRRGAAASPEYEVRFARRSGSAPAPSRGAATAASTARPATAAGEASSVEAIARGATAGGEARRQRRAPHPGAAADRARRWRAARAARRRDRPTSRRWCRIRRSWSGCSPAMRSTSGSTSPAPGACASTCMRPPTASRPQSAFSTRGPVALRLGIAGGGAIARAHAARPRHRLRSDGVGEEHDPGGAGAGGAAPAAAGADHARGPDRVSHRPPGASGAGPPARDRPPRADFATGLRDALREDPDILLIGEMRDAETIGLALTAAETGHLVLTSLHSRTSASAIERIVDIYPPERQRQIRVQLADALRAVIAQRLLPRATGGGRVPAVEFLRVTHGVANLIRERKTSQIQSALQSGRDEGMVPLERSLADLVRDGTVSLDTARSVASDVKMLDDYLGAPRRAGLGALSGQPSDGRQAVAATCAASGRPAKLATRSPSSKATTCRASPRSRSRRASAARWRRPRACRSRAAPPRSRPPAPRRAAWRVPNGACGRCSRAGRRSARTDGARRRAGS